MAKQTTEVPSVAIKPSKAVMFAFYFVYIVVVIGVFVITTIMLERFLNFNILTYLVDSIKESFEIIMTVLPNVLDDLISFIEHVITDLFIETIFVVAAVLLITFNTKLEVFKDRITYYKLFTKTDFPVQHIVKVYYEKQISFMDVGDLFIELNDRDKPLKIPYVLAPNTVQAQVHAAIFGPSYRTAPKTKTLK